MAYLPDGADADFRADMGYPPRQDDWSFEISAGDAGWTYRCMVSEGAELYLGTDIFDSLSERFAGIAGVSGVEQEDRESYLINTGLPPAQLEAHLWAVFQTAAAEAFAS